MKKQLTDEEFAAYMEILRRDPELKKRLFRKMIEGFPELEAEYEALGFITVESLAKAYSMDEAYIQEVIDANPLIKQHTTVMREV